LEQSINWLPTIITSGLITIAALLFVWRWKKMDEKFLTEKTHKLLCKNAHLEFQKYMAKEIRELKDNYLDEKFKDLVKLIKQNNKG